MPKRRIAIKDRSFCEWIAEAAFCNPFSQRRAELYARIIGKPFRDDDPQAVEILIQRVEQRIRSLSKEGMADYRHFVAGDTELVRMLVLFHVYHQVRHDLDEHIQIQSAHDGGRRPRFKMGERCMESLRLHGFSEEESAWFTGVFYQLRRAHSFITRNLIGTSPCMRGLKRRLWDNVFTHDIRRYETCMWERMEEFSILLVGETGVGKGSAAAALARSGFIPYVPEKQQFAFRFQDAFVAANLLQFSATLLESELFGHCKGAFTGALTDHDGLFSRCPGFGAVFLDEIGEVAVSLQIKLLRLLQEREYAPVGGREVKRFQGRIIAAADPGIDRSLQEGGFRHDFYYRLCSDRLEVPTLRQRIQESGEELEYLTLHLARKITGGLEREVMDRIMAGLEPLKHHAWPGNVRELEQAIRQILLTEQYQPWVEPLKAQDPMDLLAMRLKAGALTADELLHAYTSHLYQREPNYQKLSKMLAIDRRTVKKYLHL